MSAVFAHPGCPGHVLLDSGEGEKLERFGPWTLRRPDPQALWRKRLPKKDWEAASLRFERESELCAGLQHPNIVRLLDKGLSNNRPRRQHWATPRCCG